MEFDWTPADISAIVGNPIYAINIDPILAEPHAPLITEEHWIAANDRQIRNLGPEAYPRNLPRSPRATTQGRPSDLSSYIWRTSVSQRQGPQAVYQPRYTKRLHLDEAVTAGSASDTILRSTLKAHNQTEEWLVRQAVQ